MLMLMREEALRARVVVLGGASSVDDVDVDDVGGDGEDMDRVLVIPSVVGVGGTLDEVELVGLLGGLLLLLVVLLLLMLMLLVVPERMAPMVEKPRIFNYFFVFGARWIMVILWKERV